MAPDFSDFDKEQNFLLEKICASGADCKVPVKTLNKVSTEFFQEIAKQSEDDMRQYMGEFGSSLLSFAQTVDIGHPFILNLFEQNEISEKELRAAVGEIVEVQKNLISAGHLYSSDIIRNNVIRLFAKTKKTAPARSSVSKKFLEKLSNPLVEYEADPANVLVGKFSKPPVCVLNSPELREKRRRAKTTKVISIPSKSEAAEICDDYKVYYFGSSFEEEIDRLREKKNVLRENQFDYFEMHIEKRISKIINLSNEKHCNFCKIETKTAALISSRLMGFYNAGKLNIPTKYFGDDLAFKQFGGGGHLTYQARFYPLRMMSNIPERVKKILEYTESCPDVNNKPIFDYYWVLVPSIDIPPELVGSHRFKTKLGSEDAILNLERREEEDGFKFFLKLDEYLIQKKFIMPIVLGEKSGGGNCYFISYYC